MNRAVEISRVYHISGFSPTASTRKLHVAHVHYPFVLSWGYHNFFLSLSLSSQPLSAPPLLIFLLALHHSFLPTRLNLLIQHNTIHTCFQQRKHKRCLALEAAQAVEDSSAG